MYKNKQRVSKAPTRFGGLHRQVALVQALLDAGADKDRPEHQGFPGTAQLKRVA